MSDKELELKGLQELVGHLLQGKQLADNGLPTELASTSVERPLPTGLDEVTFTIGGDAGVQLFNSEDDQDEVGVMGSLIPRDDNRAWLAYHTGVSGKSSGGLSRSGFGFEFSGSARPQLGSYRVHERHESAWEALKNDLKSPRFIVSRSHIEALKDGEAVYMLVPGTLELKLKLSWSHVLSDNIGFLSSLLDVGQALNIKVGASLAANFDVQVEDHFFVAFARAGERLKLSVRRSTQKALSGAFSPSIGVEFVDSEATEEALRSILDGLLDRSSKKVENLLDGATGGVLDSESMEMVDQLLRRLGVGAVVDKVGALREKLAELKARVEEIITKVAQAKVKFAFNYEYSRMSEESTVLAASFPQTVLATHHGRLLRGKLDSFLEDASTPDSTIRIDEYIHKKKLAISHSYGFGLSIGSWTPLTSRDLKKTQLDLKQQYVTASGSIREQVSWTEQRGYKAKWLGNEWSWMLTLQGTMNELSDGESAKADELDYGASMLIQQELGTVSESELARVIDLAIVWDIITMGSMRSQKERLQELLHGADSVRATCELAFTGAAFRHVMDKLAEPAGSDGQLDRVAKALSLAMPWSKHYAYVRQNPTLRRVYFAPLWRWYMADDTLNPKDLAGKAAAHLKKFDADLAADEGRNWTLIDRETTAGLAHANLSTRATWREVMQAAHNFQRAYQRGRSYRHAGKALYGMRQIGAQCHWLRAFGAYAISALRDTPGFLATAKRTLTLEFKSGGGSAVEIVSSAKDSR